MGMLMKVHEAKEVCRNGQKKGVHVYAKLY